MFLFLLFAQSHVGISKSQWGRHHSIVCLMSEVSLVLTEFGTPGCRRSLDQAEVDKSKVSEKLLDAQHEILHLKSSLEVCLQHGCAGHHYSTCTLHEFSHSCMLLSELDGSETVIAAEEMGSSRHALCLCAQQAAPGCAWSRACINRQHLSCMHISTRVCEKSCGLQQCLLQTWESKAKHASNDKETAQKQVSELQERLDAQGSSAQQSSQAIRAIEQRTAALQRQMQVKVLAAQSPIWLLCFFSGCSIVSKDVPLLQMVLGSAATALPWHTFSTQSLA